VRRRVALSFAFVLLWSLSSPPPSLADAPWRVGWWTVRNPGVPPVVAGVELPPNNVPDGGFEVAGGGESPTSMAALLYDIPDGATLGPLVLTVADGAAPAPGTTLRACPLIEPDFRSDDGGPMSDAPEWDCSDPSPGTVDPAGASFSFDVARFVAGGQLAVAIVPDVSAQAVFAAPGDESLEVREVRRSPAPPEPSPPRARAAAPRPSAPISLPPLERPVVEPPRSAAPPAVAPVLAPGTAGSVGGGVVGAAGGLGAGSAAVGGVAVAVLGALVLLRARRSLDRAV
jgi:hypothetical protein